MIDIHTHILPGLDDGAASPEESLEMAEMAAGSGVQAIVAASHGNYYTYSIEEYRKTLQNLQNLLNEYKIPIILYEGMEIFADANAEKLLEDEKLLSINKTRNLLIEFPFDEQVHIVCDRISRFQKKGFRIILAHPERYHFMQRDPELAYFLVVNDCAMQVNKGSLAGEFGREVQRLAYKLLDANLVQVIASDAHGVERRTTFMKDTKNFLTKEYSPRLAQLLLVDNPGRIIADKELVTFAPRHID